MNNETVAQHFVPQFYLKRFLEGDGTFSVYDKITGDIIAGAIWQTRSRKAGKLT
jgi:hypothetical protein